MFIQILHQTWRSTRMVMNSCARFLSFPFTVPVILSGPTINLVHVPASFA